MINCSELVRGDVISWPEVAYDSYDPRTRRKIGERCVRGKVISDEFYDEATGKQMYRIRVIDCDGDEPLATGSEISRTHRVIFYQGRTTRAPWDDEDERKEAMREKRDRDNRPGL